MITTPQINAGHQSQINIHHYTPSHPPSVTLNGVAVSPEAVNHVNFGIIESQERELRAKDEVINLLKEQVAYLKKKIKILKAAL
jgi:hypothetical protein